MNTSTRVCKALLTVTMIMAVLSGCTHNALIRSSLVSVADNTIELGDNTLATGDYDVGFPEAPSGAGGKMMGAVVGMVTATGKVKQIDPSATDAVAVNVDGLPGSKSAGHVRVTVGRGWPVHVEVTVADAVPVGSVAATVTTSSASRVSGMRSLATQLGASSLAQNSS